MLPGDKEDMSDHCMLVMFFCRGCLEEFGVMNLFVKDVVQHVDGVAESTIDDPILLRHQSVDVVDATFDGASFYLPLTGKLLPM